MTSRLSSLLVRDGLIGVSRMEYVFQRQVIYGGSLDTTLLELELIEDGRLQQYLSLATDLPPSNGSVGTPDEALRQICNKDLAEKFHVVPVNANDEELTVLVCEPVDVTKLEGLANELDMRVTPMVVPEYRYKITFANVFGEVPDARYEKLAAKAPTVSVLTPEPSVPSNSPAVSVPTSSIPQTVAPETTQPADTSERVRGKRAPAEQPKRRQTLEMTAVTTAGQTTPETNSEARQTDEKAPQPQNEESGAPTTRAVTDSGLRTNSIVNDKDSTDALTPEQARVFLNQSDDRDEIFSILLRAIHRRANYTALFTLKGKNAVGRVALSKAGLDKVAIKNISIPLDVPSRFKKVFDSKAFSIGPLSTDDETVQEALTTLGEGEIPKSMLLLPIVMRDRVIAIAIGHNGSRGLSVGRVTEVLPLGSATADAVSRLLAKMRAAKSQDAAPKTAIDTGATIKTAAFVDSNAVPVADPAMVELFTRIESDDPVIAAAAASEALKDVDKTIKHLDFCFPGKLLKTRNDQDKRLAAAEYGPVLGLITQIGPQCGCALSEKMRDADREVRYYATLCAAEIHPADVINEFVERLFDGDDSIRALAVEALANYPTEALHTALDFARRALHSEDNERLKLAAKGLALLGDTSSIPDLIDAHSRGGEAAEASQHALFLLTSQDLGTGNRQWRNWWEKNQDGNRIDWMLGGLASKSANVRQNAAETLRSLTGEFFGYGHDLPKKQRDKARKKWQAWRDRSK